MLNRSDYVEPVLEYIAEHFSDATTEQWEHEKNESLNFNVIENETHYTLRIMDECLEGIQASELNELLVSFNVAQVMRDIRDFPIVVTNSGCIFGSP